MDPFKAVVRKPHAQPPPAPQSEAQSNVEAVFAQVRSLTKSVPRDAAPVSHIAAPVSPDSAPVSPGVARVQLDVASNQFIAPLGGKSEEAHAKSVDTHGK